MKDGLEPAQNTENLNLTNIHLMIPIFGKISLFSTPARPCKSFSQRARMMR
jgi:hypothetical protein